VIDNPPSDKAAKSAALPAATARRGPLLRVAIVSALFAGLLGGGALSAPAPDAGSDFSQTSTVITLGTGAVSLLLLVVAALAGRSAASHEARRNGTQPAGSAGSPPVLARRLVALALVVLAVGVLTGIGVGVARTVDRSRGDSAWVAISSGLLVTLIVLAHARWLRRRLR
jgi:hypothetical protein